jgi:hypothetical protein
MSSLKTRILFFQIQITAEAKGTQAQVCGKI